jgi:hypothetical protein
VGDKAGDTLTAFPSKAHEHRAGEMGDRIRQFDWSTTPLGPMSHWPQSLRTVINILLSSRYAMWMAWGPELSMLYNDAYQPTLGLKHPRALGMRASEVWAEIWPDIGPRIETVLTGEATYDEGLLLFLERSGFPEETYHTFSYSPLTDDDGQINGMLCVVTEETDRVIGERRVALRRTLDPGGAAAGAGRRSRPHRRQQVVHWDPRLREQTVAFRAGDDRRAHRLHATLCRYILGSAGYSHGGHRSH